MVQPVHRDIQQLELDSVAPWPDLSNHEVYWTDPVSLDRIGTQLDGQ